MHLEELAPHTYACLQPDRGLGWSNSGLVARGGGLVVDTFWDLRHTRELLEQYARVSPGPARRVVNTHHNGDHCWGNQLFAGAEIIAHRRCAEAFAGQDPAALQRRLEAEARDPARAGRRRIDPQEWDFRGIRITPPTTVFDDRLALDLDGTRVDLIYVGPAHTAGDVIVHVPEHRVVYAGDILFRLCTPIGWEGTLDRWVRALEEIAALEPAVVVPGHGPLCGVEGPLEMRDYLEHVRSEARRSFERGLSAPEACRRIDLGPYAGWTEPERVVFIMERAYRELRGDPYDAPMDVPALMGEMDALADDPAFPVVGGARP